MTVNACVVLTSSGVSGSIQSALHEYSDGGNNIAIHDNPNKSIERFLWRRGIILSVETFYCTENEIDLCSISSCDWFPISLRFNSVLSLAGFRFEPGKNSFSLDSDSLCRNRNSSAIAVSILRLTPTFSDEKSFRINVQPALFRNSFFASWVRLVSSAFYNDFEIWTMLYISILKN